MVEEPETFRSPELWKISFLTEEIVADTHIEKFVH
jgi:hypothetical protein